MLSGAQLKHIFSRVTLGVSNEAVEMLRLRCATLSMTEKTKAAGGSLKIAAP